ncbi:hypothetical protein BMS3Abin07_01274 [bacterium BMS3Abin07]|nr:hypothetical protein BMS3Abin07_01274 [bacterium BMS3Abin07]GBE31438.1 hypothetical protein BMS3Bbin05_00338 [bacterium BMS3Bbin05]HDO22466.1 hypothetical protein [Nitrospirota bacterium]HDZ88660.1 hypothetical protein [Nitrospirota bacterium]
MIFFCPICWREIDNNNKRCPQCGADIRKYDRKKFQDKLINALGHPEPETVQRAVWILGRLKSNETVEHLIRLFRRTDNPFLKISILNALEEIGSEEALEFITESFNSEIGIVGKSAQDIIEKRWKPDE